MGEWHMRKVIEINEALWVKLSAAARRAGRTPENVLRGLIREFLESEDDRRLDVGLAKDVQSSGYTEDDSVRLVREYRGQVRTKPVGKVDEAPRRYRRTRSR
jgi:hypothetical protein